MGGQPPERLNTRVIDALSQLSFNEDVVASRSLPPATVGGSN
jgi:hypothetical protein